MPFQKSSLTRSTFSTAPSKNQVFGSVVEGLDVVKKIESVGSGSGKTSAPVKVAASGQL